MSVATAARKPLGVRATPEQRRILTEAAAREHRSVSSFVLNAALSAAQPALPLQPRRSVEEIQAMLAGLRTAVRKAVPADRDIVAEFLAERRAEAERE